MIGQNRAQSVTATQDKNLVYLSLLFILTLFNLLTTFIYCSKSRHFLTPHQANLDSKQVRSKKNRIHRIIPLIVSGSATNLRRRYGKWKTISNWADHPIWSSKCWYESRSSPSNHWVQVKLKKVVKKSTSSKFYSILQPNSLLSVFSALLVFFMCFFILVTITLTEICFFAYNLAYIMFLSDTHTFRFPKFK